jgi:SulP family sulfate permease
MRWPRRLLPGPASLRGYERAWLRGDLLAGVTVAAYLVPQVMAYAGLAGLPPVAGLWAMLAPLALYAILGSSRQLSVGPESTTALMTAAALAVVVGGLCLLAFVARLGFVADLLSKPILVGYLAGVAVTMIVGQLGKLTGIAVHGDGIPAELASFAAHLSDVKPFTLVFALAVLALLFLGQWRFPQLPTPLVVVLLATVAVVVFNLQRHGLAVVGAVPRGLPTPALPDVGDLRYLLLPAVGVLVVGYTDTVLTGRAFAVRGGYPVDANQELLALGAANLGAGVLRGFPVSSSGSRTALAVTAGARTQVYSLVVLACVVAVLLFAGPLLARFPTAALGAIVVYAATRLIDVAGFRRLAAFRRTELLLAFAALAGVHDIDDYPQATTVPGLLVYRYDSPLFFANAQDFRRRALAAVADQKEPVRWFVLNVEANVEVDSTGLDALDDVRAELTDRGVVFALARAKQDLMTALDAYGVTAAIRPERIFPTLPTAVAAYRDWCRTNPPPGDR